MPKYTILNTSDMKFISGHSPDEVILYLQERHLSVESSYANTYNMLYLAVYNVYNPLELTKKLLKIQPELAKKINDNIRDGATVPIYAALEKKIDLLKFLIETDSNQQLDKLQQNLLTLLQYPEQTVRLSGLIAVKEFKLSAYFSDSLRELYDVCMSLADKDKDDPEIMNTIKEIRQQLDIYTNQDLKHMPAKKEEKSSFWDFLSFFVGSKKTTPEEKIDEQALLGTDDKLKYKQG